MDDIKKRITSFHDLDVYLSTYEASITVLRKIVPKLPQEEKFDLIQQLRRSAKAVPRLIAEAYSKRHQKRGFQTRCPEYRSLVRAGCIWQAGCPVLRKEDSAREWVLTKWQWISTS